MDGSRKRKVRLAEEQRPRLEDITRNGNNSAKRIMHARVLLMSDQEHPLGRYKDADIARHLGVSERTVGRVRTTFARHGEAVARERKVREAPPVKMMRSPRLPPTPERRAAGRFVRLDQVLVAGS